MPPTKVPLCWMTRLLPPNAVKTRVDEPGKSTGILKVFGRKFLGHPVSHVRLRLPLSQLRKRFWRHLIFPIWMKNVVTKPEANLGMPLKVPKSWGVAPLDCRNSCSVIFLAY